MRWKNFNGSGKTITATTAQVISFTGNDLPSGGTIAFHFATSGGANNSLANVCATRIRVKADGVTIYDLDVTHFRKFLERFTQSHYCPLTTALRWSIPFNLVDVVDDDAADECQFPRGTVPTVEFTTNASVAAGAIYAGWTQTDVVQQFSPMLYGQAMNIAASATQAQFPLQTPDGCAVRGFTTPTANLGTFKMTLNQFDHAFLPSAAYLNAATGDMLLEAESWEDGGGSTGSVTITSHAAHRIGMIEPSGGSSRVLLDTLAGWSAANELGLWLIRNV